MTKSRFSRMLIFVCVLVLCLGFALSANAALYKNSSQQVLSGGTYTVGKDIPAGAYTFTLQGDGLDSFYVWADQSACNSKSYSDASSYSPCGDSDWEYMYNPVLKKVILEEGNVVEFEETYTVAAYSGIEFNKNEVNVVPAGRYTVGEDIPAGTYTVSVDHGSTCFTAWKKAYHDYKDSGLLYCEALIASDGTTLEDIVLQDGNIVDFNQSVKFVPAGASANASSDSTDSGFVYGNTSGTKEVFDDGTPYTILFGTKADYDDPLIIVYVLYADGTTSIYGIYTKADTVLEALTDCGLCKAEKASWGYSVTTVDQVEASYSKDGAWWAYYEWDNSLSSFESISVGLETIAIVDGNSYAFVYSK